MAKVKLIQEQLDVFCNDVIESNVISEFKSEDAAKRYLVQRGYKFDDVVGKWVNGNCVHFPIQIEVIHFALNDIRHFM